ncbi:MAG: hypothetical protein DWH94_01590 [Planctomycetota bacterium]|nr:MAG: hypothetical protein DWH94_01590 [Planctomycetota bacterium]
MEKNPQFIRSVDAVALNLQKIHRGSLKNRRFPLIFLNNPREPAIELVPRLSTYAHALRMSMISEIRSTLLKMPETPKGRHC